nr:zinc finger protein 271 [Nothobranchius furzeri]XP_054597807.1 zinc finger protein 271 [Nothobranchius furzeri]
MEPVSDELWSGVNQEDPELLNIKEEPQLVGFTAISCQFEEDEEKFLLSQFDLHQTKDGGLSHSCTTEEVKPESGIWSMEYGGAADGTSNPDLKHEVDSSSSESEVFEENDQDGNSSDSSVIFLSASEPKTKDRTNDWNESRSSSIRVNKESATVKQNVDSSRKDQAPLILIKSEQTASQNRSVITAGVKKPPTCEICDKTFMLRSYLYEHRRSHAEQKRFSCELCGKRFSLKRVLKNHMRIHTGEKPFACELCGKSFSQKLSLITHTRIHTGEKPFACEHCGRSFSTKGGLTSHVIIHTGEKPFTCEHCGRSFNKKTNLDKHIRVHLGQKCFVCEICGKRFSQSPHVTAHMMRIHKGNKTIV